MSESDESRFPRARLRRSIRIGWIWLIPAVAVFAVGWMAWDQLSNRGPTVKISFHNADGVDAGTTKVRLKSVDIGTVEKVELSNDLSSVIVTARMSRQSERALSEHARFWIVRPQVSAVGVSGLETIMSGPYIEMDPGRPAGPRTLNFTGLDSPPIPRGDVPGTSFELHAQEIHTISQGAPLYFRGIPVGEVAAYQLSSDGTQVEVTIFIKSPFDRLVRPESVFWSIGGLAISTGAGGLRATARSLGSLIGGGIAFYTPPELMSAASSPPHSEFQLYDDEAAARAAPAGLQNFYTIEFPGPVRGLAVGAAVQMQGLDVGRVTDVHLEYDAASGTLRTPVTIGFQPSSIAGLLHQSDNPRAATDRFLSRLVAEGLRARLTSPNLLTGQRIVSLEFASRAPAAQLKQVGPNPEIPSISSGDLEDLSRAARDAADNLNRLITSPEMKHSVKSLDDALSNLDQASRDLRGGTRPLVESLRRTSESAQRTLDAVGRAMGGGNIPNADVPQMVNQLTEAARSVRLLSDYLEQHPDALIRGRPTSDR